MKKVSKEVQQVLSDDSDIAFEQIAGEETSPLNAPVIEKDIAGSHQAGTIQNDLDDGETASQGDESQHENNEDDILDAPEQQIDDDYGGPSGTEIPEEDEEESEGFQLPTSHARQAADTFLGMADNFLEIGGGFFVKVKKHTDFYDLDEIIQVIDEHNTRNVKRLRLEKEDKALLKPLLVEVLKKKARKLTPEQQLMGALISILVKKAQLVLEVRAENEILVDRILQIIREERGTASERYSDDEQEEESEFIEEESITEEPGQEYEAIEKPSQVISPESVLEIADVEEQDEKGE
ncbi:hypothetical protein QQ008_07425 [Fulvivirgaceae bacterium BMA10]|uniref:Uncharacterized protein n=1 Tax=Splendidivirga corallicola TaxID=3051826 RepID=A0ABT8KKE5_9BACT|nr:hypothetical protein [Fulvivirgaceae bacterium BMA10]